MKFILFVIIMLASAIAQANGYQFTVINQGTGTATITTQKILDANAQRAYLIIQNKGTENIIVKFGSAQTGSEGLIIIPGGNYEMQQPCWDAVYLKSATGSQGFYYVEGK